MDYYLQPDFLSPSPPLEITFEEYSELAKSSITLTAAFSLEENYDLLVGNYLELENSILSLSTSTMLRQRRDYADMFELTAEMNRRAVNFLSSARLFVDQVRQRVGACNSDPEEIKKRLNVEYEQSFEYRFMEALRNHVQHSGSAIHELSPLASWWPQHKKFKRIFTLEIHTRKSFLALDPKFKNSVLEECSEKVDFMQAARKYLKSLSSVQDFSRSNIKDNVEKARSNFEGAIKNYMDFSGAPSLGLAAFHGKEGKRENKIPILLEWDDVRVKLAQRNRPLISLDNTIIASEMIPSTYEITD